MVDADEIFRHYLFTDRDRANLKRAGEVLAPYVEDFAQAFYDWLADFPEMRTVFPTKQAVEARSGAMRTWFEEILSGEYDQHYLSRLHHVGSTHVRREIPIHWVAASMDFKRGWMTSTLATEVADPAEREALSRSINKILDINLDVLLSSYHEEQLKRIFLTKRMDSALIRFAERFAYGLNLVLVLALIGLSIGVSALFAYDIYTLIATRDLERGLISALGTLLIIWVIVELMDTEIRYLRGEKFRIEVFVAVALVSIIRELLIASLAHEPVEFVAFLVGAVLVLGVVYFLVSRSSVSTR